MNTTEENETEDWWSDFFKGPFGELQKGDLKQKETEREVAWIVSKLGYDPKKVLDAPCGTGRHSLALSRLGHAVTGVDFNPALLEMAEQVAKAEGLPARFEQTDLRELSYEGEFDAVCNLWSSVGYFSDADNERTLCNLARAVKPGGYLLLDVLASENLARRFLPRTWGWSGEADDRVRICEERHWNFATARVDTTWTFFRNGSQDVRHSSIRLYTCHELVSLLTRYGLTNFACFGNDGEPFSVDSRRLWLEAQKPA